MGFCFVQGMETQIIAHRQKKGPSENQQPHGMRSHILTPLVSPIYIMDALVKKEFCWFYYLFIFLLILKCLKISDLGQTVLLFNIY